MTALGIALLALGGFGLLLGLGYRIFTLILGTDEARDARSRNPRHDLPTPWWTGASEPDRWWEPRQEQPR